jgi:DNA-binding NarL/FixJ family response regulator
MGAEAFAERARRELLATGEIVHECTTMQVSVLTAPEAHIARLAVDGHTNPEIAAQLHRRMAPLQGIHQAQHRLTP